MTKINFPHLGTIYTPILKNFFENLGCEVILPPKSTIKTIQKGSEVSPKLMCVPFKWNTGNYIESLEKHKDLTLVQYHSCGSCKFHTYYLTQTTILKELGYKFKGIYPIRAKWILNDLNKITKANYFKIINSARKTLKEIKHAEKEHFKSEGDIKIGVCGEIFTILNSDCNLNLFRKLKERNCYVETKLLLSNFIKEAIFRKKTFNKEIRAKAKKLFPEKLGGHGFFSIESMLYFIKMNFDGVVFVRPLSCSSEIAVEPIINSLKKEHKMPLLTLNFDETTSEINLDNRIEAFVETIKMKNEN